MPMIQQRLMPLQGRVHIYRGELNGTVRTVARRGMLKYTFGPIVGWSVRLFGVRRGKRAGKF